MASLKVIKTMDPRASLMYAKVVTHHKEGEALNECKVMCGRSQAGLMRDGGN